MATINVRKLNDDVLRKLKLRAAWNEHSLEGEVRHILARAVEAVEDDMAAKREAFSALAKKLRRTTDAKLQTPSEILIREDRNSGHRLG